MIKVSDKTMFFTSNRADAMTKKVNDWIKTNIDNINTRIETIEHGISYSDNRGYMMSCMIRYKVFTFILKSGDVTINEEEEDDAENIKENNK